MRACMQLEQVLLLLNFYPEKNLLPAKTYRIHDRVRGRSYIASTHTDLSIKIKTLRLPASLSSFFFPSFRLGQSIGHALKRSYFGRGGESVIVSQNSEAKGQNSNGLKTKKGVKSYYKVWINGIIILLRLYYYNNKAVISGAIN